MTRMMSQRLYHCCLLLLLFGMVFPTTARPVRAEGSGYAYHWLLKFDFATGMTGELFVEVGHNDNGAVQMPALHSRSFPVTCQRVGAVNVFDGVAKFNGGYLECRMDLKAALQETFAECDQQYPGCTMTINDNEYYRSIKTKVDLASPPGVTAPIFTHPSATYAVTLATAQGQMQSTLSGIGSVQSGLLPLTPATLQPYLARWGCVATGDCGMHFAVGGAPVYIDTVDTPASFATPLTVFYIGRDQAGGVIAAGSIMDNLIIDPGNGLPTG